MLYAIASFDAPRGLAIEEELEEHIEGDVHHGRLYPNLDTLGEKGLVEKGLVEKGLVEKGEIDRRTNSYSLTDRGRRELEARRAWEDEYVDDVAAE